MPSLLLPRFSFSEMSDKKSPPRKEKPFIVRTPQSEDRAMKRKLLSPGSPTSLEDDDKKTPIKRKRHSVSLDVSPLSNTKTPVTGSRSVPLSERQQLAMIMRMSDETSQEPLAKPPSPASIHTVKRATLDKKVHKRNERGELPIHLAAIKGDVKLLKKLIKAGADVNVADFAGWTPLHEASNRGWLYIAKQLLRAGANVNVQGLENDTPLHDASINGHKKLVELLLKHGANPLQLNSQGKTPLDVAASPDMIRLLKKEIISSGSDSSSLDDVRSPMSPDSVSSMKDEDRSLDPEDLPHPRLDSFSSSSTNNRRLSMPKSPTDGKITSPRLCLKFQRDHLGGQLQKTKDSKEPQYKSYSVTNVSVEPGADNPMFSPVDSPASSVDSDLYNSGLDMNNFSSGRLKIALSEDECTQPNWKHSLTVPSVCVESNDSAPMEAYPRNEATCDLNRNNSDCVTNSFSLGGGSSDSHRNKAALKSVETGQFSPNLNWVDSKTEESMELPDLEIETNTSIPSTVVTSEPAKTCDTVARETCSSTVNDTSVYTSQRNHSVVTSTSGSNNLILPGNGVCDKDASASQDGSISSDSSVTFSHVTTGICGVSDSISDNSCSGTSVTNTETTNVHTGSVPAEPTAVSTLKWELRSASSPKSDDGSVHSLKADSAQPCSPARSEKESRDSSHPSTPKVPPLKIIIPTKSQASSTTDNSERLKLVVTNVKSALPYVINPFQDQGREAEGIPVGKEVDTSKLYHENNVLSQSPTSSVLNESQNPSVSTNGPKSGLTPDVESDSTSKDELKVNGESDRVDSKVLNSIDAEYVKAADKVLSEVEEVKSDGDSRKDERKEEPTQRVLRSAVRSQNTGSDTKSAKSQKSAVEKVDKLSNADSPPVSEQQTTTGSVTATSNTTTTSRAGSKDEAEANFPPRKRKLRPKGDNNQDQAPESSTNEGNATEKVPNPYEMYLVLRKKIGVRRQGLTAICPKIPQGFKDYLLQTCNYVLQGNATSTLCVPTLSPPNSVNDKMRDLFVQHEETRYQLRLQHLIEREKLMLSIEQEILREHGRAARALANQGVPLSACTILKDEEIYNISTDQQEEKDKKNRTRYNGRQFISWIQDVSDKYEKIKELLILRQKQEADSLYAIQKLEWEWRLKELKQCDRSVTPDIDELHVPLVHVQDNFDLLPT